MKSLTEHLWFDIPNRRDYINITRKVEELVEKSSVKEGLCLVKTQQLNPSNMHSVKNDLEFQILPQLTSNLFLPSKKYITVLKRMAQKQEWKVICWMNPAYGRELGK